MELMVRDFVVDIETRHASEKFIQAAQAKIERGNIDSRLKDPEKIKAAQAKNEADYQKALEKVKSKSACLNAAPIGCIGLISDDKLYNFSCFNFSEVDMQNLHDEGVIAVTFEDEKCMMKGFSEFVDAHYTEFSRIVGFNSCKFDFPKIRLACIRNDIKIPEILTSKYRENQIDIMRKFSREYNCEDKHRLFISLKQVCLELSIPYKKSMDGAEIPDAIERGEFLQVTLDCTNDTIETYRAFLKMRGF